MELEPTVKITKTFTSIHIIYLNLKPQIYERLNDIAGSTTTHALLRNLSEY